MRLSKYLFNAAVAAMLAGPIVACSFGSSTERSALSDEEDAQNADDCTLTQGYWKNHPGAWPVDSLKLGTRTYTKAELIAILKTPVKGNGLIKLAHQLIAAKLNVAAGANDADVADAIDDADDLIGDLVVGKDSLESKDVGSLNDKLDAFNNGKIGPGHCDDDKEDEDDDEDDGGDCDHDDDGDCDDDCDHDDDGDCDDDDDCDHDDDGTCDGDDDDDGDHDCPPPAPVCGNAVKEGTEACDDGNTANGDGCSSTCTLEPICGNGVKEGTEACDDGNTINGDGCSSTCTIEEHDCPSSCP